ncbi:MAG: AraC family transcriptional regulator ligand-binding domain-containing protein, partial [Pseudomonadota bacterium]
KFVPPGSSGLFGQLQVTSPTIRDLMRTTVAFAELALRPVVPEWEDFGENGVFTARLPVENVGSIRQLTDLLMALLVFRIRLGAGDNWLPLEVTFETPKPKETRLYYDFFGDQIRFDEPYFSIVIDEKALDCKLPYDVAGLNDTIRPLAEEALADIKKSDSFPTIVANEIRRQLSDDDDERISLGRIADALSMSTRGLQWRLAQEGADYHTILGQVREEIAIKMLGDPKIQVADVAIAMGFAQTSVFTRWSIRCLGDTPSAVRRKMQHGAWVGPPRAGSV